MARWLQRVVLIGAIAGVGAAGYGCSSAATPGPASSAAQPSAASAGAPASSGAPATSAASPSAAGTSPSPGGGAPGDPQPAATKVYKCSELISEAEMRSASGYADAKSNVDDQSGNLSGQTYCSFFTGTGISITVNVFTAGAAWDQAFLPLWRLGQITPGAVRLDGIGDSAVYSGNAPAQGAALVTGHGIIVIFSDLTSVTPGQLKGVDLQDQVTKILKIVAGRV